MKPKARNYWNSRLVPCWQHGEAHCWLQENGKHVSRYSCTCAEAGAVACPIDAHRIPWCLENPQFDDSGGVVESHEQRSAERAEHILTEPVARPLFRTRQRVTEPLKPDGRNVEQRVLARIRREAKAAESAGRRPPETSCGLLFAAEPQTPAT